MLVWSSALVRRWQFGDVRILGLTNAFKGKHGLWPDARKRLFELLSRGVRISLLTYALGIMKLQEYCEGLFCAVALSKPHSRKVANGCSSMLGVRRYRARPDGCSPPSPALPPSPRPTHLPHPRGRPGNGLYSSCATAS